MRRRSIAWRRHRRRVAAAPGKTWPATAPGCPACPRAPAPRSYRARRRRSGVSRCSGAICGMSPSRIECTVARRRQRPDPGLERAGQPGRVVRIGHECHIEPGERRRNLGGHVAGHHQNRPRPCSPARPRPHAAPSACRRCPRASLLVAPMRVERPAASTMAAMRGASPLKTATACGACSASRRGRICASRPRSSPDRTRGCRNWRATPPRRLRARCGRSP